MLQRNGLRKSLAVKVLRRSSQGKIKGHKEAVKHHEQEQQVSSLSIGHATAQGRSHKDNEDRAVYEVFESNQQNEGILSGYVGVFDGHGGSQCSEYVSKVVGRHIKEKFKEEECWENGEEVVRELFHDIDQEFCELAQANNNLSGCCATILLFRHNELVVGNIGDCKAILQPITSNGNYGDVVDITEDHRADSSAEERRIQEAGGEVKNGRILSLQPSRSFGDIDVKIGAGKDVVIAQPDVDRLFVYLKQEKSERPFLVVASDGVWDVLTSKQVAAIAKTQLKKFQHNPNICAEKIVECAVSNGSTDDITVAVVVW